MHVPAKVEYGIRAMLAMADRKTPTTAQGLATAQGLPTKFLTTILTDLHRAGLVTSQRGTEGGYSLACSPSEITIADIMRVLEGPLTEVRGRRPEMTRYEGAAVHLQEVWVAARASLRRVLEQVTLEDLVVGRLPAGVLELTEDPDVWTAHSR